jgi:tetratricopeptide (TPR) repeat protein
MSSEVRLGSFLLGECIGAGGMGTIWSAVHEPTGAPAALKCIRPDRLAGPAAAERFQREVRAVAGLRHPSIIEVYDYGTVDEAAQRASGGELAAGGPYLAMELARFGDARQLVGWLPWRALRALLLQVLDALAHAHAHRVIHLDVKPANLLRCGDGGRLKLTDFGIARVVRGEGAVGVDLQVSGTPDYMAPEQLRGDWRDLGPWTDLYAVGGLAYRLACARRPFPTPESLARIREIRERAPPPRLPAGCDVPRGFQEWLDGLLLADPEARVAHAADAALALAALPEDHGQRPTLRRLPGQPAAPEETLPATELRAASTWYDDAATQDPPLLNRGAPPGAAAPGVADNLALECPVPDPERWRRARSYAPDPALSGVGLGLYGLRAVPLVDRDAERERLWERLQAVRRGGGPEVAVLRGPSGFGKSRLAEWLCVRAGELGAADALTATHSPIPARGDGLQGALDRLLRTAELDPEAARERLRRWLEARGASRGGGVLSGLFPGAEGAGLSERGRHAALLRVLEVAGRRRPQILYLDDVQWGLSTLAFVEHLLAAGPGAARALVVMAAREEALAERPDEAAALARIGAHPGAVTLEVGPLPPAYRAALVRGLLGLEGDLAEQLERRTAGNAMFAVQLVGDWVTRGLLAPGPAGFSLRTGATPALPDDLHGVWRQRLDRLLAGRPPADGAALELAAALGQDVSQAEWRATCLRAGQAPSPDLLGALVDSRLARHAQAEGSWSFVHGMLRESLLRRAAEAGQLAARHRACAGYLETLPGHEAAARCAAQHLAAGDYERAADLLIEVIQHHYEQERLGSMAQAVSELSEAIERAGLPPGDERRIRAQHFQARHCMVVGRLEQAEALAAQALEGARRYGHLQEGWRLLTLQGQVALQRGDPERARALWQQLEVLAGDDPAHFGFRLTALHGQAHAAARLGDTAGAVALCERALALADAREDPAVGLRILLARARLEEGDLDAALAGAQAAARAVDPEQLPVMANRVDTLLGDVLRQRGDPAGAEACFRRALERSEVLEPTVVPTQQLNIGAALQDQGRYQEGGALLRQAADRLAREGRGYLEAVACVMLLASAAAAGDWAEWDALDERAGRLIGEYGVALAEVGLGFEAAMALAEAAGEPARAARARAGALRIWEVLGRAADVQRLTP